MGTDCLWHRLPRLVIVLIGGNHDSPPRLQAPAACLHALGVRVLGGLPSNEEGEPGWPQLLVPLSDADGRTAAWCGVMPYLRSAHLSPPNVRGRDPSQGSASGAPEPGNPVPAPTGG